METDAPPRPLSPIKIRAARLLAQGETGLETARILETRPETVSRWHRDPAFIAEIRRLADLVKDGDPGIRVEALIPRALDVLGDVMSDARADQFLKIQAAQALLSFAVASRGSTAKDHPES
jgi:hypothetical protein